LLSIYISNQIVFFLCPIYVVEFEKGRGLKLAGNGLQGDIGHLANSTHPECNTIIQNARFELHKKFSLELETNKTTRLYKPGNIGKFPIISTKFIKKDEEIIVSYGSSHWKSAQLWNTGIRLKRSASAERRDERQKRRSEERDERQKRRIEERS
jgi:hypothetical protein